MKNWISCECIRLIETEEVTLRELAAVEPVSSWPGWHQNPDILLYKEPALNILNPSFISKWPPNVLLPFKSSDPWPRDALKVQSSQKELPDVIPEVGCKFSLQNMATVLICGMEIIAPWDCYFKLVRNDLFHGKSSAFKKGEGLNLPRTKYLLNVIRSHCNVIFNFTSLCCNTTYQCI